MQQILKEIDEDFTDEELDEVIAEVSFWTISEPHLYFLTIHFKIDIDKSSSIDFNEFVKLMTF